MQALSRPTRLSPPEFPPESLSRLLSEWGVEPAARTPAAARLGAWLGWADSIEIAQVLGTPLAGLSSAAARTAAADWASAEVQALRGQLMAGFEDAELTGASEADAPGPALGDRLPAFLQHLAQQQRVIASRVAPLRARLRTKLESASSELARLALLDAYVERALAAPERRGAAGLSVLIEARARKHHAADPQRWCRRLGADLQRLLRAELDQRLQPVLGLVEALSMNRPR